MLGHLGGIGYRLLHLALQVGKEGGDAGISLRAFIGQLSRHGKIPVSPWQRSRAPAIVMLWILPAAWLAEIMMTSVAIVFGEFRPRTIGTYVRGFGTVRKQVQCGSGRDKLSLHPNFGLEIFRPAGFNLFAP